MNNANVHIKRKINVQMVEHKVYITEQTANFDIQSYIKKMA